MNSNETRTLWISIAAGLFATFLLYSYSQEKQAQLTKKFGSSKRVVVAARDIAEMETIDDTMLDTIERPVDFIEPNAMNDPELAVGKVAVAPMKKGEQLLLTKLLTPGPDTGIALQVSPNKRAVTIPVDEVRGVAKLIRPGDRIDITAAVDIGKGLNQRREVQLIMQDVVVLATGLNVVNNIPRIFEMDANRKDVSQITLTGDTKFTTVTVEASPKEAQDLLYILSTSPGNLFLTLRNPNDRNIVKMPSSTQESVLGKPSTAFSSPPPRVPTTISPPPSVPQKASRPQPAKPRGKFIRQ